MTQYSVDGTWVLSGPSSSWLLIVVSFLTILSYFTVYSQTAVPTNFVTVYGYRYGTLDNTQPRTSSFPSELCQNGAISLPSGWIVAKKNCHSLFAVGCCFWQTQGIVLADGFAYWSNNSMRYSAMPLSLYRSTGNQLVVAGSSYSVKACTAEILITDDTNAVAASCPSNPVSCVLCIPGSYSANGASAFKNGSCTGQAIPRTTCLPGRYSPPGATSAAETVCLTCPVGRYSTITDASHCTICPPGTETSIAGSTTCNQCTAGKFSTFVGTGTACTNCPLGYFSSSGGSSQCTRCNKGTYANITGSTTCTQCAAGKYSIASFGATSSAACIDCEPGFFSSFKGATGCFSCFSGTYSTATGALTLCPPGTGSTIIGARITSCAPFPAGVTNSEAPNNVVSIYGQKYATLANTNPYTSPGTTPVGATTLALPANWSLAPNNCHSWFALGCYYWQTNYIALANNNNVVYVTKGSAAWASTAAFDGYTYSNGQYTPSKYNQILITDDVNAIYAPCLSNPTSCTLCGPGTYSVNGATPCTMCPSRKYVSLSGATSADACTLRTNLPSAPIASPTFVPTQLTTSIPTTNFSSLSPTAMVSQLTTSNIPSISPTMTPTTMLTMMPSFTATSAGNPMVASPVPSLPPTQVSPVSTSSSAPTSASNLTAITIRPSNPPSTFELNSATPSTPLLGDPNNARSDGSLSVNVSVSASTSVIAVYMILLGVGFVMALYVWYTRRQILNATPVVAVTFAESPTVSKPTSIEPLSFGVIVFNVLWCWSRLANIISLLVNLAYNPYASSKYLGVVILPLIGSLITGVCSAYIIKCTFAPLGNTSTNPTGRWSARIPHIAAIPLSNYLAQGDIHSADSAQCWSLVFLMMLAMDTSALIVLPWTHTEFAHRSSGFPCLWVLRISLYASLAQASLVFFCALLSIAFILSPDNLQSSNNSLASSLGLTFVLSFLSLVFVGLYVVTMLFFENTRLADRDDVQMIAVIKKGPPKPKRKDSSAPSDAPESGNFDLEKNGNSTSGDVELNVSDATVMATITIEPPEGGLVMVDSLEACPLEASREFSLANSREFSTTSLPEDGPKLLYEKERVDKNNEVLKEQILKLGIRPLEYLPLADIQSELASLFALMNNNQRIDEGRLEYLLSCLEINPDYKIQLQKESEVWQGEVAVFTKECLSKMRTYIPSTIFTKSLTWMTEAGYSKALAKRLLTKKCLWLLRLSEVDIQRIHEADLMSKYITQAQGLDIVELAALFAVAPKKFCNDVTGKKERWRLSLEESLKAYYKDYKLGTLTGIKARHPAYKGQTEGLFKDDNEVISLFHATGGESNMAATATTTNIRRDSEPAHSPINISQIQPDKLSSHDGPVTEKRSSDGGSLSSITSAIGRLSTKRRGLVGGLFRPARSGGGRGHGGSKYPSSTASGASGSGRSNENGDGSSQESAESGIDFNDVYGGSNDVAEGATVAGPAMARQRLSTRRQRAIGNILFSNHSQATRATMVNRTANNSAVTSPLAHPAAQSKMAETSED